MSSMDPAGRSPSAASIRLSLIALTVLGALHVHAAEGIDIRIAYLGERDSDSWYGANQGLSEANAQGRFLGLRYQLISARDQADALAIGAVSILADVSPLRLLRLAEAALETPVFNISAQDDELREACQPNLFHTIPSLAMLDDAERQWQRKSAGSSAAAQAWHPTFRKYAAAQLNKRYSATSGRPMSDAAWAAWAAVKLLGDTFARLDKDATNAVMDALKNDVAFDGQKGIDMSFRNTGQLRQPLLLIENGRIVGEAPVRGIVGARNLDSLGLADCLK
jgi:hypothetical protein